MSIKKSFISYFASFIQCQIIIIRLPGILMRLNMVLVWISNRGFSIRRIVLIQYWQWFSISDIFEFVLTFYRFTFSDSIVRLLRSNHTKWWNIQRYEMMKMSERPRVSIEYQRNWLSIVTYERRNVVCINKIQNATAHGIFIFDILFFSWISYMYR